MDRIDAVTVVGSLGIVALSVAFALETVVVAAAFGGFLLSLSLWRLYDGQPWEALGWLAWLVAAVGVVVAPSGPALVVTVVGSGLLGAILLLGGRYGVLLDVWSVDGNEKQLE
ncbi:hypothetical protein RBH26_05395 [Natronolimnohabitans sp. A-GB9]|uniref:hypothetical protein n=1 Tax=Natronolimnohabitans sp. A-GB9 TaxID=3069757 RepID=UPI0027AED2BA|nr:hypothetical protein [Natronolimnohabitans sp. A-GB9]MDQ2049913.1 hypothetical protein [Natronolimnohabitans sp. A-GB9]